MTIKSMNPEIVQHLIDGGPTELIYSAFSWLETPEGNRYWEDVSDLDKLTDKHIEKLQNMLEGRPNQVEDEPVVIDSAQDIDIIAEVFKAFLKQSTTIDGPSGYQICSQCYEWKGHKDGCIVPRAKEVQEKLLKGI